MWQVIGQPKATRLLDRSLNQGNLSHAYLFVGPQHVGKMTLANNLAQAVNCQAAAPPCGQCRSCLRVASQRHADIQVIETASANGKLKTEIGIDQIREIQGTASLKPYEGRHRVFIINSAELLTNEAANCLLKTLEEPPPNVLLILLAVNESRLPSTIPSRCQRVELRPLSPLAVEQALVDHFQVIPQKAKLLSRLSCGCLGWAISACSNDKLLAERYERLTKLLSLISATRNERFAYAAQLATQLGRNRNSVREVLDLWLGWWRDLLLVKGRSTKLITNIDQERVLRNHAKGYSMAQIKGFIESLQRAPNQLDQNANPRLVFEVLMLNIPPKGKEGNNSKNG